MLAAAGLGVCLLISGVRPSGVLQPVQKVLVLVIAGLHVHSGAGFVLGADVVTQAGTCQRGIIMPAGGPVSGGNAFQNIHRFCIVPVADIVVGGLHLRRFPAVIAAAGPAIGAAKAKGVKPEPKAKRILVLLLAAAAAALPIIAGRAAAGCTGPAAGTHPHDLAVSGLYIFELVLAGGVVRV